MTDSARKVVTVVHDNQSNDSPHHGGQDKVVDHKGCPDRRRHQNPGRAGCKACVHKHGYEQASGAVIDLHHENPVSRQDTSVEKHRRYEVRQGDGSIGIAGRPVGGKQVPQSMKGSHDETGAEHAVRLPEPGDGKARPAQLLEESAEDEPDRYPLHYDAYLVLRGGNNRQKIPRDQGKQEGQDPHQ